MLAVRKTSRVNGAVILAVAVVLARCTRADTCTDKYTFCGFPWEGCRDGYTKRYYGVGFCLAAIVYECSLSFCCPGYTGANCDQDINACLSVPCGANTVCVDKSPPALGDAAGRVCSCSPGFEGNPDTGCTQINACVSSPCPDQNSVCVDLPPPAGSSPSGRVCRCRDGLYNNNQDVCLTCPVGHRCSNNALVPCDGTTGYQDSTGQSVCKPVAAACAFPQTYQLAAPTISSNRVCRSVSACNAATEFQIAAPTPTSDRVCGSKTECTSTQYQVGIAGNGDRICSRCTTAPDCALGQVLVGTCSGSSLPASNPLCVTCNGTSHFQDQPNQVACKPVSPPCLEGFYESSGATPSTDRVCAQCNRQCETCKGPSESDCLRCAPGLFITTQGQCVTTTMPPSETITSMANSIVTTTISGPAILTTTGSIRSSKPLTTTPSDGPSERIPDKAEKKAVTSSPGFIAGVAAGAVLLVLLLGFVSLKAGRRCRTGRRRKVVMQEEPGSHTANPLFMMYSVADLQRSYETPAVQPSYEQPVEANETPFAQPSYEQPVEAYQTPFAQPSYESPAAQPSYESPSAQPSYESPAAQPSYELPSAQPSYELPSAQPSYELPTAQPAYESPVLQRAFKSPIYEPMATRPAYESPVVQRAFKSSAVQPAYESPAAAPAYELPVAQPTYELAVNFNEGQYISVLGTDSFNEESSSSLHRRLGPERYAFLKREHEVYAPSTSELVYESVT